MNDALKWGGGGGWNNNFLKSGFVRKSYMETQSSCVLHVVSASDVYVLVFSKTNKSQTFLFEVFKLNKNIHYFFQISSLSVLHISN